MNSGLNMISPGTISSTTSISMSSMMLPSTSAVSSTMTSPFTSVPTSVSPVGTNITTAVTTTTTTSSSSSTRTTSTHQSSSTSSSQSQPSSTHPPSSNSSPSKSPTPSSSSTAKTSFPHTSLSPDSLETGAAALLTSDSVTTFIPTTTILTFPTVSSSVSPCVTTCLQSAVISVDCATITSVECYCKKPQFISNTFKCIESQCPADLDQAEDIAEQFCALVSTSLTFPSPTVTVFSSNTTTSNAVSATHGKATMSSKLIMSSFVFVIAFYVLQELYA